MRIFSNYLNKKVNEQQSTTSDVNPGNTFNNTGVMNHLTPVGNIVTQIRNLFSPLTGVVASVGEDGFSVKLNSSKFVSQEEVNKMLYDTTIMKGTCLATYIMQQGLTLVKPVCVGQYIIVYFCPTDIKASEIDKLPTKIVCKEMLEYNIDESEMVLVTESDDDEEMQDVTKKKITELINSKDKVKAAKQLELLVAQSMELPREYYFAGVKDKEGGESIALRWKYSKRRPNNKTLETVRSLVNIFNDGKDGVWVQDFDKDAMFKIPEEVETLIKNFLELIGASETNDPCIWSLAESDRKDKKEDDEDKDKDKDEDKDNDKKSDDDSKDNDNKDKDSDDDSKDKEDDDSDNLL